MILGVEHQITALVFEDPLEESVSFSELLCLRKPFYINKQIIHIPISECFIIYGRDIKHTAHGPEQALYYLLPWGCCCRLSTICLSGVGRDSKPSLLFLIGCLLPLSPLFSATYWLRWEGRIREEGRGKERARGWTRGRGGFFWETQFTLRLPCSAVYFETWLIWAEFGHTRTQVKRKGHSKMCWGKGN